LLFGLFFLARRLQLVVRFVQLEPKLRNKLIYFNKAELIDMCQRGVADMLELLANEHNKDVKLSDNSHHQKNLQLM
jgi:hypothetical protein